VVGIRTVIRKSKEIAEENTFLEASRGLSVQSAPMGDEGALALGLPKNGGPRRRKQHPRATVNLSTSDPCRSDHSGVSFAVKFDGWLLFVVTSMVNGTHVKDTQSDNMTHDAIPLIKVKVLTMIYTTTWSLADCPVFC
jgi:hypothetical protein